MRIMADSITLQCAKILYAFMATIAVSPRIEVSQTKKEPSLPECLGLLAMAFGVQIFEYSRHGGFWHGASLWLDNRHYLGAANFIVDHHYNLPYPDWHFMGLPYVIAALSMTLSIPGVVALVGLSIASSLGSCVLIHRLYGGSVAAIFAIVDPEWIRGSILGSSEPLFLLLVLSAFAASRKECWIAACLFAALATTVRPVGVFALFGVAVVLAKTRRSRLLLFSILITGFIGVVYLYFARLITGSAFTSFASYQHSLAVPVGGFHFSFPFAPLIRTLINQIAVYNWFYWSRSVLWVMFSIALAITGFSRNRKLLHTWPMEAISCAAYFLFFLCYNEDAAEFWPRFMIPVLPFQLAAIRAWLPSNRLLLWLAAASFPLFGCIDQFGSKEVLGERLFELLRHLFHPFR